MEPIDGDFQTVAADETHRVIGTAVRVVAEAVDRHDPRMFQPAGDLRFPEKSGSIVRIAGPARLHLLQGDLSIDFLVMSQVDDSQTAGRVSPQDAESLLRRRRRNRGVIVGGDVGGNAGAQVSGPHQGLFDLRVVKLAKFLFRGSAAAQGSQRAVDFASVLGDMAFDKSVEKLAGFQVESAMFDKEIAERSALVEDPRLHAGEKLFLRDEVALERHHPEDQVEVGGNSHGDPLNQESIHLPPTVCVCGSGVLSGITSSISHAVSCRWLGVERTRWFALPNRAVSTSSFCSRLWIVDEPVAGLALLSRPT
jgi:hypothetical protein